MNKKYLPLIVLVAIAIVWFVAPIVSVSLFGYTASMTALDAIDVIQGLPDILVIFAPLAAVVLGAVAIFAKPGIAKMSAIITGAAYALGFILYILDGGFEVMGWGMYVTLVLMVVNVVLNIKGKAE